MSYNDVQCPHRHSPFTDAGALHCQTWSLLSYECFTLFITSLLANKPTSTSRGSHWTAVLHNLACHNSSHWSTLLLASLQFYAPILFESLATGALGGLLNTVIINIVNVLATLPAIILVDRLGRRILLMTSAAWMFVAQVQVVAGIIYRSLWVYY